VVCVKARVTNMPMEEVNARKCQDPCKENGRVIQEWQCWLGPLRHPEDPGPALRAVHDR